MNSFDLICSLMIMMRKSLGRITFERIAHSCFQYAFSPSPSWIYTAVISKPIIIFTLGEARIFLFFFFFFSDLSLLSIRIEPCLLRNRSVSLSVQESVYQCQERERIRTKRVETLLDAGYFLSLFLSVNHLVCFGSSIFLITRLVAISLSLSSSMSMLLLLLYECWMAFLCASVHTHH